MISVSNHSLFPKPQSTIAISISHPLTTVPTTVPATTDIITETTIATATSNTEINTNASLIVPLNEVRVPSPGKM